MKILALVAILSPIVFLVAAGATELRASAKVSVKLVRLIPIAMGIAIVICSCLPNAPGRSGRMGPISSGWMAFASSVVASSGGLVPYARRRTATLVAVAGLVLTFLWIFFSEPGV